MFWKSESFEKQYDDIDDINDDDDDDDSRDYLHAVSVALTMAAFHFDPTTNRHDPPTHFLTLTSHLLPLCYQSPSPIWSSPDQSSPVQSIKQCLLCKQNSPLLIFIQHHCGLSGL